MNKILNTTILALTLLLSTLQAANPISQAKAGGKGNNPVSQKYLNQGSGNNPVATDQAGPRIGNFAMWMKRVNMDLSARLFILILTGMRIQI